jgi:flagellar protein FliO/FliZ
MPSNIGMPDSGVVTGTDERSLVLSGDELAGTDNAPSGLSSFFAILRLILVLTLVAAAIYGIVFLLKKFSRPPARQDPFVKVLAGASLGANRFVHIVSVGTKAWLVGATDGNLSLIAEITDQETVDAMLIANSKKGVETDKATGFAGLLRKMSGLPKNGTATETENNNPKAENIRKNRERLRGL